MSMKTVLASQARGLDEIGMSLLPPILDKLNAIATLRKGTTENFADVTACLVACTRRVVDIFATAVGGEEGEEIRLEFLV